MRRPPIIAILTVGACALSVAAPVAAQTPAPQTTPSSANAAGLRYLTWPGRTYRPAPVAASPIAVDATGEAAPVLATNTPTRPPIIPHGGQPAYGTAPALSAPPRQGLTPASAWIGSQAPAYQPSPAAPVETTPPQPYRASAPAASPWSRARAVAPSPAPAPTPSLPAAAPAPSGYFAETAEATPPPMAIARSVAPPVAAPAPRLARTAAATPEPATTASPAHDEAPAAADPMAPRRDAPIFRLQRPEARPAAAQVPVPVLAQAQAQPAPAAEPAPAQGGARYYSVHRQAGRQPDATPLPAPVYLDALPVNLTSMPASTDLAEPPAVPNLIRNANGRIQALPANEDPTLP